MSEEKVLAEIELSLIQTYQVAPPEQHNASNLASEPIANIIANNCGGCSGPNNQSYVQRVMQTCGNSRANQNDFPWQGDTGALEQDNPEDRGIPIRRNEPVHGCLSQKGHAFQSDHR